LVEEEPKQRAKDARDKLEGRYGIKLKYSKAWVGLMVAIE